MSNKRIYPVRGDDPRLVGAQVLAFNPLDYANKDDAVDNFVKVSGSGSVAYNASGTSVIGKGTFEFTGTGVWVLNTLYPVSYDSGLRGTAHIKIASGSATVNIGYESFDSNGDAIAIAPTQNNFILNGTPAINSSTYTQFVNYVRGEGASQGTLPVGTRFVRPRIEISASTGVVTIDAFIITQFIDNETPAGVTHAFAGPVSTPPQGYLVCDGSPVSRTTYARLYAAIGVAYGEGDGSTTFHLPDLRGRFIRGAANGSTNDPDRASRTFSNSGGATGDNVGSLQGDAIQSHYHTLLFHQSTEC